MMTRLIYTLLLLLLPLTCSWADGQEDSTYPTPARLFHIARSANRNLVCYDFNAPRGQLDKSQPIKVYWVNREEHPGVTNGLSFIQRKMAYGYKVKKVEPTKCSFTLTAYPGRVLTLQREGKGYACHVSINNEPALLRSLYVKAHPHNPLKVEYVELRGISLKTHQAVSERVKK